MKKVRSPTSEDTVTATDAVKLDSTPRGLLVMLSSDQLAVLDSIEILDTKERRAAFDSNLGACTSLCNAKEAEAGK
ncbi:MAG: hypothetical protein KVP17_000911 [Porospora cf. gigantea B]|uniref:uncharacterized protein n=1 Tax=Porospora cf. gigantea B TaxID=2853592 RepID=UPI003571DAAD|nr:MAG: hypothetical protein KVP17_000911 [Porospora cf. gigantea B]